MAWSALLFLYYLLFHLHLSTTSSAAAVLEPRAPPPSLRGELYDFVFSGSGDTYVDAPRLGVPVTYQRFLLDSSSEGGAGRVRSMQTTACPTDSVLAYYNWDVSFVFMIRTNYGDIIGRVPREELDKISEPGKETANFAEVFKEPYIEKDGYLTHAILNLRLNHGGPTSDPIKFNGWSTWGERAPVTRGAIKQGSTYRYYKEFSVRRIQNEIRTLLTGINVASNPLPAIQEFDFPYSADQRASTKHTGPPVRPNARLACAISLTMQNNAAAVEETWIGSEATIEENSGKRVSVLTPSDSSSLRMTQGGWENI
ncbi:hypothetical protein N7510_006041 [Penicillium lagena]|uniref:uncharacterized protein n=1 Tax=Penicillium lagena TaxID=94218 RepID=UPI00254056EB|nr:uncharacterized protein N7510_006041 [Penicillium lagena]KAJ5612847.1 hypothetical protein N7510_006041 [Penicillium lagena]